MNNKDYQYLNNYINEKILKVFHKGIFELTDFLDPSEIAIIEEILKRSKGKISYSFYGGSEHVERKRLLIVPFGEDISLPDFKIVVIEAKTRKIQREITHRDLLGALMGSGIKREKVGDIFLIDEGAAIIADSAISSYIIGNFPMIKNNIFSTKTFEPSSYDFPQISLSEKLVNVTSYRLDVLLSKAYNIPRNDAQEFITSGKVKVNHKILEKVDYQVKPGTMVSVRTKGRFIIKEELGRTKKDNIRIVLNIY